MKDADPGFIGNLTEVSGARFIARLQDSGADFEAYRQIGADIVPVPVDADGIDLAAGRRLLSLPKSIIRT